MFERDKNSFVEEWRKKTRQLIVDEYVKQPRGSPQGNRRADGASGHCARALVLPLERGHSENVIVPKVNTPTTEAAEEEREPGRFNHLH